MREAGDIQHGNNMMRFESETDLRTLQWKEVNAKMKAALLLIEEGKK